MNKSAIALLLGITTMPTLAQAPLETIPLPQKPEPLPSMREVFGEPQTTLTWGGFIKVDALYSRFSEGDSLTPNGRDFFVPASIPVSGAGGEAQQSLDFHAKETRLFLKTETDFGAAHKLNGYIEMDFLVNPGSATPNVTNAYNPGLRRATISYGPWLVGQDWTTFQDLSALPEGLDFIGPTEATVFGRQPLLRYTMGPLQFALENSETQVLANGGASAALSNDNVVPDLVARYRFERDWGQLTLAGLLRQLRSDSEVSDEVIGGGLSLTGKLGAFGDDDVRFGLTTGEGIGRYVGINTIPDAVALADGSLDAIGLSSGYLTYRHVWNAAWRSNVTVAALRADTTETMGAAATREVRSLHANLLVSPLPKITLGVELMHAERESHGGADGALERLQVSAKYAF